MSEERWMKAKDDRYKRKEAARDVTEIIPAKAREDDGERRHELVRFRFDRAAARFVDPREQIEMPEGY